MKVIKKSAESVKLEPAHDGAGSRKLFVKEDESEKHSRHHPWLA